MAFHLYRINELYSNADGTIQFIEMIVGPFNGESFWQGQSISVSQGGTTHRFVFPTNLPSSATANTTVLIATQAFADLGIAAPDYVVPDGFLFVAGGTLDFAGVDAMVYGALPADGTQSLSRNGATAANSPRNFAGETGMVQPGVISGTAGNDHLIGTAGNDVLSGAAGDDTLDGAAGMDSALYVGGYQRSEVEKASGRFKVTDKVGNEGRDTLFSIEKLQFADKTFDLVNPQRTSVPAYNTNNGLLFDAVFYLLDNPELVPTESLVTALAHYFATGAAQGRAPNSWFDATYYENRWPDLKDGNFSDDILFVHYNLYGVWEGRSAGPAFDQFDGNRYLADNPDVAAYVDAHLPDFLGSRSNGAIAHYVIYGQHEERLAYDLVGQQIKLDYALDLSG